jgi:hypothetical protein
MHGSQGQTHSGVAGGSAPLSIPSPVCGGGEGATHAGRRREGRPRDGASGARLPLAARGKGSSRLLEETR